MSVLTIWHSAGSHMPAAQGDANAQQSQPDEDVNKKKRRVSRRGACLGLGVAVRRSRRSKGPIQRCVFVQQNGPSISDATWASSSHWKLLPNHIPPHVVPRRQPLLPLP